MKNGKFQCFAYAKNEKSDLHYFENLHSLAGRPARPTSHRVMRNEYRSACALTHFTTMTKFITFSHFQFQKYQNLPFKWLIKTLITARN